MSGSRTLVLLENTVGHLRRPNPLVHYHIVPHSEGIRLFAGRGPRNGAAEQAAAFASAFPRTLAERPVRRRVKPGNDVRCSAKAATPPLSQHVH